MTPLAEALEAASPWFRVGVEHQGACRFLRARRALAASIAAGEPAAPWACQELVQTFLRRGESHAAEAALRAQLPDGSPLLHHALGYLWRRLGRAADAEGAFGLALERRPGPWAPSCELGWMHCARGDDATGLALLEAAAAAFARAGDAWGEAIATTHLATVAVLRWRLVDADALLARALELKRRCGDRLGQATVLYNRAVILFACSRHVEAIEAFEESLNLQLSVRFAEGAAASLNGIGACHLELGNAARASRALRAALRIYSRVRHEGWRSAEANVRTNLGLAWTLRGDRRAATREFRAALRLLRSTGDEDAVAAAAANLARHELSRGRPRQALAVLDAPDVAACKGASVRTRMMLLTERARAELRLGRVTEAIGIARESVALGRDLPGPLAGLAVQVVAAQVALGQGLVAAGRATDALREIEAAVATVDAVRTGLSSAMARMGLEETLRDADDALVHCLLATSGDVERAWSRTAGAKARQLEESLRVARPAEDEPLARIHEVEAEIRHLATSGDASEAAVLRLRELRRVHADLEVREPAPVPAGEARRREPRVPLTRGANVALLDYNVHASGAWLFVVHGGHVKAMELALTASRLARDVERLVAPLRAAGRSAEPWLLLSSHDEDLAAALGRALVEPALAQLPPEVDTLLVSPDGPLHGLPFELLVVRGEWLADTHRLSSVPSAALLRASRRRVGGGAVVLAWSPESSVEVQAAAGAVSIDPLPAAVEEARTVAALLPEARLLLGPEATAAAYRREAPSARWLHLTTHGLVDPESWGLSAIVVAPEDARGSRADLLTAQQLARIPLVAELVTLSACDTAVGRVRPREGRLGLVRAFLQAGAESVLASHWPVDDETTRRFMTAFYRRLRCGEDRGAALSGARRELRGSAAAARDGREHPFFWAAFGLSDLRG